MQIIIVTFLCICIVVFIKRVFGAPKNYNHEEFDINEIYDLYKKSRKKDQDVLKKILKTILEEKTEHPNEDIEKIHAVYKKIEEAEKNRNKILYAPRYSSRKNKKK